MTLNFFNTPQGSNVKRTDALNTVRQWFNMRPFLPRDFRQAMLFLLPELKAKADEEIEYDDQPDDDNESA